MDDDLFDDDFPVLTEADLAAIDASVESALASHSSVTELDPMSAVQPPHVAHSAVTVELEQHSLETIAGERDTITSPMKEFRSFTKTLSVSDLVGPSWCEFQFEYRQRHKRSKRLGGPKDSFTSLEGQQIPVCMEKVELRKEITKAGQAVHTVLEREIRPLEDFIVHTESTEETWALRLVNMVACVEDIIRLGRAREIPVLGVVHGQLILGIVDEIERRPLAQDNGKRYALGVIDTKTRYTRSLPREADAMGSKLQLMLYHRLLEELWSPHTPYSFDEVWSILGVNDHIPFSHRFLLESDLVFMDNIKCLHDLTQHWVNMVQVIEHAGMDPALQIIYRLRKGGRMQRQGSDGIDIPDTPQGVEDFIKEVKVVKEEAAPPPEIIGTTEFFFDPVCLDEYLSDILEWWHGRRSPKGVSLDQAKRCDTCEFRPGCEWRAKMAAEYGKPRKKDAKEK